jgi:hypothetical protein
MKPRKRLVGLRRVNTINVQFATRPIEMLESPAYRTLSLSAHRVISRVEIELGSHGGNNNGQLPVTKGDFIEYGVHHEAVAPAIREAEALGFVKVERGRGGNAEHHKPSMFRLTFAHERYSRSAPPTHDWRKIKTVEEALEIAQRARAAKSAAAVSMGKRGARKNISRPGKAGLKPTPETGAEAAVVPAPETGATGWGRKPGPLSISGVRGAQRGGPDWGRAKRPCPLFVTGSGLAAGYAALSGHGVVTETPAGERRRGGPS